MLPVFVAQEGKRRSRFGSGVEQVSGLINSARQML
jgi:hypothetical protein